MMNVFCELQQTLADFFTKKFKFTYLNVREHVLLSFLRAYFCTYLKMLLILCLSFIIEHTEILSNSTEEVHFEIASISLQLVLYR